MMDGTSERDLQSENPARHVQGAAVFRWVVLPLAILVLVTVVVRAAWMGDDAYITLRTIDNFWNGFGLRWNPLERVQAYTHPLWMMLLLGVYGLTREAYYTTLAVSAACLAITVWAVQARLGAMRAAVVVLCFAVSRAFVDFSSSGLENPLCHVILTAFGLTYLLDTPSLQRYRRLSWMAALCALTRLDLALLLAPAMLHETRRIGLRAATPVLVTAVTPLLAWHTFTLVYYGSLTPNTALAKLGTGIGLMERLAQGAFYFRESLRADLVTIPAIVCAVGLSVWRFRQLTWLVLGLCAYCSYVWWIGGDFMSGRFFTAPFVIAALIVGSAIRRPTQAWCVATLVLVAGVVSQRSPLDVWTPEDDKPWSVLIADPKTHGIVDERRVYYWATGFLRNVRHEARVTNHAWAQEGMILGGRPQVKVRIAIGLLGYYAGPMVHIIDRMALSDPLLARRAIAPGTPWLIGQFERDMPEGYEESVADCIRRLVARGAFPPTTMSCADFGDSVNHLKTPGDRVQYADVVLMTQGRLFSRARWSALARLNGLSASTASSP